MPLYQLKYLSTAAAETIDVEDAEEAEAQARRRLLFRDPGFTIAVLAEGRELCRVMQMPRHDLEMRTA